jgi:pimeloyl-ACP methyl ester carboxylesterase
MVFMDRRRRFAIAVSVVLVLVACSGDGGGDDDTATSTTTTTAEDTSAPAAEVFAGSIEDFYVVPDPLPEGEPGDLIRTQVISETDGLATLRVMYHSQDAQGTDRAVTGVITYPTAEAPEGGWPVISTAHGTTGIAEHCALSRRDEPAPGWGVDGVWAMSDYVGQGPVGELHPYLSKPSEGNAVIDIVRAARLIPAAHAGERWISIGHSQGGHGALSAHELAAQRAPELELVGTVALAPGAMLDRVYGGIDPIVTAILTMMAMVGGASEHPEIDIADYLSPEALAAADIFETGCLDEITEALIPIAAGEPFIADPRETEPAASLVRANDVGEVAVDGVPVYLASGTIDDRVVIDRVRDLFDRMCDAGQVTELTVVEGADHNAILGETAEAVTAFIEARLAGDEPTDSCEEQTSDG